MRRQQNRTSRNWSKASPGGRPRSNSTRYASHLFPTTLLQVKQRTGIIFWNLDLGSLFKMSACKRPKLSTFTHPSVEDPATFWLDNSRGLCCWHDTMPFTGPVYSYPTRKEPNTWVMQGVFCSLQCVKRYLLDNCFTNTNVFTLFSAMCVSVYGVTNNLVPAPHRQLLDKFCLDPAQALTIEQFRQKGLEGRMLNIIQPPVYPFQLQPDHVYQQSVEPVTVDTRSTVGLSGDTRRFPSRGLSTLDQFYSMDDTPSDAQ